MKHFYVIHNASIEGRTQPPICSVTPGKTPAQWVTGSYLVARKAKNTLQKMFPKDTYVIYKLLEIK